MRRNRGGDLSGPAGSLSRRGSRQRVQPCLPRAFGVHSPTQAPRRKRKKFVKSRVGSAVARHVNRGAGAPPSGEREGSRCSGSSSAKPTENPVGARQ